ncbi:hypothetical protein GCM10027416_18200 [Okibacterium endophyticum]
MSREVIERPLIALISGVAAAIPPAQRAFGEVLPEADLWNLLDDRLVSDAMQAGQVSTGLIDRMMRLIEHATLEKADAIVLTCSVYGFLAPAASERFGVPVHGPDDAALQEVVLRGLTSIYLVASVDLALRDAVERAAAAFAAKGADVAIVPILAEGARAPSLRGDHAGVADAITMAIQASARDADAVLLANYSLADAADRVSIGVARPVIDGPAHAAHSLRETLSRSSRSRSDQVR